MAKTIKVKNLDVTTVEFSDDDGDKIAFKIAPGGNALIFSVNGKDRPPFKDLQWSPAAGLPGISMPDIQKGFPIPMQGLETNLGGLSCLAKKAGIKCNIGQTVVMPDTASEFFPPSVTHGAAMASLGGGGLGGGG
eukprot:Hpha_TRINITY_DN643_c0_g1::TRINITY_DN643_c0_g1_i1::g.21396::m.21396